MDVAQLYAERVRPLSPADRLRLATLILNDIPAGALDNYRDEWTDEDIRDASRHSLQRAAASFGRCAVTL